MFRLEDILKVLLVENSRIISIEDGLKFVRKFIPRKLIMNKTTSNLKKLENENKQF